MTKREALLEIRIENIPARFITSAETQLEKTAREMLATANLPFETIKAYGTYKRLVLHITGVPPKTQEKTVKAVGPLAKLWKDASGNFTPQSSGFAKAQGTTPDKLSVEMMPKGEVLVVQKKIPGKLAVQALSEIFSKVIVTLEFPKTMVWEETRVRFARPVRSLMALYGEKIIPLAFAGIKTGRLTVGLSAKGSKPIKIASAEKYFKTLEHASVLVKDEERLATLVKELEQVAKRTGLKPQHEPELLKENLYLIEYPVCVVGQYAQEFLKLPLELVNLVMNKQLKFFTMLNQENTLQPYFIGVRDGVSKGQKNVEEGFRNVLEARFRDAIFFYTRDLAVPFEDFREALKTVVFQEKLGSMLNKAERVEHLACALASAVPGLDVEAVKHASRFVYADLSTNVVKEFTELQGLMGYYYARNSGLSETAAKAIGDFYRPVGAKSPLPSSKEASVVSMAGKLDTLASEFSVGHVPSGSEDPHGLRRQALGLVRIVLENSLEINLTGEIKRAQALLPQAATGRAVAPIMEFIWQRAEVLFAEEGFKFDEIKAAKDFFIANGDLLDCRRRISALHLARTSSGFSELTMAFKRAKNIIKQAGIAILDTPEEGAFEKDEERRLYSDIHQLSLKLKDSLSERDYAKGLAELITVKPALDGFFEKVMVMVEDSRIKENRLKLLGSLVSNFDSIADLSQLQ